MTQGGQSVSSKKEERRTKNEERRTKNEERRTKNEERRTKNEERRTKNRTFATCDLRLATKQCPITRSEIHIFPTQNAENKRSLDIFRFKFFVPSQLHGKFPQVAENRSRRNRGVGK